MPRGQPDWGIYTQTPVASGISDPGEAAARLGSINIYDRRGWTVWMDDFEAPALRWSASSSVGGTLPILSSIRAWMGVQSAYFVTAAVALEYAALQMSFPLVRLGRVGEEFFIWLTSKTPGYFSIYLLIYDGSNISRAELLLDSQARNATIVTPAGIEVVATNCFNTMAFEVWVPVKLVVDMDTDRYVRLLIGPQEIDLSPHSLIDGGATTEKQLWISMALVGGVIGGMTAFVDNFILTQTEP